jgi:hypothetical protein
MTAACSIDALLAAATRLAAKTDADELILADAVLLDEIADVLRDLNGQVARLHRLRGYLVAD